MPVLERDLVPALTALLESKGYFVPSPTSVCADGRGEFGILISSKPRRVDVVAARWSADGEAITLAIESKATPWAVYDGLGQAVQYQSVFDEVYIATPFPLGADAIARSTLVDLGLATSQSQDGRACRSCASFQRPSFRPQTKATYIAHRLLAHFGKCERQIRFGFGPVAFIWYAGRGHHSGTAVKFTSEKARHESRWHQPER